MPARKGMAQQHPQINLFLPVSQEERSENAEKRKPERKSQSFSAGKCLRVCLCILMLLLSWNFLFSGESECTRPNHHCKKIFLTQPDDDVSAVNKNCISVVKLQDRSHGAKRAYRVREIRTALAAPPKVRAKMISSTMLRNGLLVIG